MRSGHSHPTPASISNCKLRATTWNEATAVQAMKPGVKEELRRDNPVPEPPFLGQRYREDINLQEVLNLVNVQALFRGRWGYRRGKMSATNLRPAA